jgi:hypothetical protein
MLASQKHKCTVSLENEGRHWAVNCKTCELQSGWLYTGKNDRESWLYAIRLAIHHAEYHWIR